MMVKKGPFKSKSEVFDLDNRMKKHRNKLTALKLDDGMNKKLFEGKNV